MSHVRRTPQLAPLMALHAAAALMVRLGLDMAPAIAALTLARGPDGVALITGGGGAGAIAGGLRLAERPTATSQPGIVVCAVTVAALAAILLPLAAQPEAAGAIALAFGVAIVLRAAGLQSLLQLLPPPEFNGRVLGPYDLCLHLSGAVGGLALGLLADRIGPAPAFALVADLA